MSSSHPPSSHPPSALFDGKLPPMNLKAATVLITGGSSGIGLGLVAEFLNGGSKVVICGRREQALQEAQKKYPSIQYFVADVETPQSRIKLFQDATKKFPDINILINNAGIQRRVPTVEDVTGKHDWSGAQQEIDINFSSVVHLCNLFIPHFLKKPEAAIINVSSGLAFVSTVHAPIYAATKAAVHSYTVSLRLSLAKTNVRVCELVPPSVKSHLGGLHDFGEETDVFCRAVYQRFASGELEFGHGFSDAGRLADRQKLQEMTLHLFDQLTTVSGNVIQPKIFEANSK